MKGTDKSPVLRKHVSIIHSDTSRSKWGLVQRKVVNSLLLRARETIIEAIGSSDKEKLDEYLEQTRGQEINYEIPLQRLKKDIHFDSNDHSLIKEALFGLATSAIEYNIINSRGVKEWAVMPILSYGKLVDGKVYFRFPGELREELLYPSVYANIDLAIQNSFISTQSLALYENVYRFINVGETPIFPVDTLKRLLGIDTSSYVEFKAFNTKVIKKAANEINAQSNIEIVEVELKRTGRKVSGIRFKIKPKAAYKVLDDTDTTIEMSEYEYALHEFGITKKQSQRIFDRLSIADLEERINAIQTTLKQRSDIDNPAAYAWTVLNAEETPSTSQTRKSASKPSAESKLVIEGKMPFEDIERRASDELMLKLKDMYVSAMSSKRTAKDKDLHSLAVSGQWDDDALYNSFASFVESTMYIRRDLMKHLTN